MEDLYKREGFFNLRVLLEKSASICQLLKRAICNENSQDDYAHTEKSIE